MGLFCKKFSVCSECAVHFEPVTGEGSDLCSVHRTTYLQLLARKRLVMSWAERNWEKLEEQAVQEKKEDDAYSLGFQMQMALAAERAQAGAVESGHGIANTRGKNILGMP